MWQALCQMLCLDSVSDLEDFTVKRRKWDHWNTPGSRREHPLNMMEVLGLWKWEQTRLSIQSLLEQGHEPLSPVTCIGRNSEAGRGVDKLYNEQRWRNQVCSGWRRLAWRSWKQSNQELGYLNVICLQSIFGSLGWPWVESRGKI